MSDLPKLGIDIGTTTIKMVELSPAGKGSWKLQAAAAIQTPTGGVSSGTANLAAVSQAIVKLVKESGAKSKRAVAALPEEQVSSHVVELPFMKDDEVRQALEWQVEQYIPIPKEKAVWSYEIIKRDQSGGGMEVLLVAVSKQLVETYTQTLEQAGLEVVALETELMATARAVVPAENPLSLVIDLGARSTDMGVVSHGQLVFARTIPTGGEAFTRAIETGLGLSAAQAEQYKSAYGFDKGRLDGKLASSMQPVLTTIAGEIRKTIDFYTSKHASETMQTIVLSGGVANLPEIAVSLSGLVGIEVAVGNPFARVKLDANQNKQLIPLSSVYGVAVGLAQRSF